VTLSPRAARRSYQDLPRNRIDSHPPKIGAAAGRTRSWLLSRFKYRSIYRVRDILVASSPERQPASAN
jgi:hypothetical protein